MKVSTLFKFILLIVLLLPLNVGASERSEIVKNVSGRVLDAEDSTAMEYVTVAIYLSRDSSLVTGGFTDINGNFKLDASEVKEPYYLRLRFIAYQEKIISVTNLSQKDFGSIYLNGEAQAFDEVTVEAEKSDVIHKVDKKVYNAEKIIAAGSTALDVLKNIPSIEVDGSDKVSYRGQEDVIILIDGRPTNMQAEEVLKMMDANSVDQVELISNPSAKYDAEGMSGIINVITKKERKQGFNGSLNLTYGIGENHRLTGNLALNYTSDKWRINATYFTRHRTRSHDSYTDRKLFAADTLSDRLISEGGDLLRNYVNAFIGSVDYFINDNNTIYVAGTYGHDDIEKISFLDYRNVDSQENLVYSSDRDGTEWGPLKSYSLNMGWQSTFGKKKNTMDFDVDYSGSYHLTEEVIAEDLNSGLRYTTDTYGTEDNTLMVAKLDFGLPLNDSVKFETGLRNTFRSQDSFLELTNASSTPSSFDTVWTNQFKYEQNVLAGYLSFEKQWKTIAIKLGLRGEQTSTRSDLESDTLNLDKDYFELFPTAFLSWTPFEKSFFTLNYGRRINRPTMGQINPFIYYSDRFMLDQGNPYIDPEFIHVMELGYSYYSRKLNVEASIYYRSVKNKIRRYMRQEGLVSILSSKNIANSNLSGIDFSVTYKPHKVIKIISSTYAWNYQIRDEVITNNELVNSLGVVTNLDFFLKLKGGWNIQWRNNYRPRYWVQQGYILSRFSMSLGVSNYFFKKRLKLTVTGTDLLNTQNYYYRSDDQPFDLLANWDWESRILFVSANWYFGKKFKGKHKRRGIDADASDDGVPGI